MSVERIPELVRRLYAVVSELDELFKEEKRSFTPDGHLVGSIGEVLAKYRYGLELLQNSSETHDAVAPDSRMVQIKATQGSRVALSSKPDYLVVLKIAKDGTAHEVYNGPGDLVWNNCGKPQKNGQSPISIFRLKQLSERVSENEKIGVRNNA
ncbi:MAG: hypothetical protein OMOMHJEC_03346 [Xanthomonadales bacterium]|nr:hypothetical protein [Xanthomonadales bacterium]